MTDPGGWPDIAATVAQLAARWAGGDKALLREVFPLLVEGRPVPVERIAERTGAPAERIEEALVRGRAGRDAAGRVVELSGLTLTPTLHRTEVGEVALFSCCALLAHMVPLLLARSVRLESVDPQSRGVVRLEVTPTGVGVVTPPEAVGSFLVAEPRAVATDVVSSFCSHVHHFRDPESAGRYVAENARRFAVGIDELRAAAELLYRMAWS